MRFAPIITVVCASGLLLLGVLSLGGKSSAITTMADQPVTRAFIVLYTGEHWNGKPVYVLENNSSQTLNTFVIQSWSGANLPLLAVATPPHVNNELRPLNHPPYTIPPHAKVWFIGPNVPPIQMTVLWLEDGQAHYVNLKDSSIGA